MPSQTRENITEYNYKKRSKAFSGNNWLSACSLCTQTRVCTYAFALNFSSVMQKSSRIKPFRKTLYSFVLRTGKSQRARSLTLWCRSEKRTAFPYMHSGKNTGKNANHASRWRNADEKQRRDCSHEGDREFRVISSRFYSNSILIWKLFGRDTFNFWL